MLLSFLLLLGGLALLFAGAESLVRGASALAFRLGFSALLVGLTVVAFGTSAPELVVSVQAARSGAGGIAVGNVIGSNVANVALILGLSALLRPLRVEAQIVRLDVPLMVAASFVLGVLLLDKTVSRIEGAGLVLGLVAYLSFTYRTARRTEATLYADTDRPPSQGSVLAQVGFIVLGLTLLIVGADWLVRGATTIAAAAGLSEAVIGLTLVAVGTSVPELATSIVAVLRGADDLAVGNVVGSNLFNILGILGIAALVDPLVAPGLTLVSLGVMAGLAALLLPLARSGYQVSRLEGTFFVLSYGAYVTYLVTG